MSILVLNNADVMELLPMNECISVMREALISLAQGNVFQPLRTVITPPKATGLLGLMPSFISAERPALGLKVISVFPGNSATGKDIHQGVVLLLSPDSGEPLAMMNASAITAIRTAAVSAVATDILARADACELTIVGAGVQARTHLKAMSEVRSIKRCCVATRDIQNAYRFAGEMQSEFPFPIEAIDSVERSLAGSDLIVTATTASEPVIRREWISAGAHLNAVGASIPSARELDTATVAAASLFVDRRESAEKEAGDYLFALREEAITPGHIRAEIGEVLTGEKPGRTSADEITIFKSLGLAVEDVAAAQYLYTKAVATGRGSWLEF